MTTFQVYCKGTVRKWFPYSREYRTTAEAEACVRRAKALGNYSVTGAPVSYKIVRHIRQAIAA